MGLIYYFRKPKKDEMQDEMSRKIRTTATAKAFHIMLISAAIIYIANNRLFNMQFDQNATFSWFIFYGLALTVYFQWYYKKHMEKIPF